jgi:hypothetical protein
MCIIPYFIDSYILHFETESARADRPVLPPSAGNSMQRQVEDERRLGEGGLEAVKPAQRAEWVCFVGRVWAGGAI